MWKVEGVGKRERVGNFKRKRVDISKSIIETKKGAVLYRLKPKMVKSEIH
jgi:hypothetical protein